MKGDETVKKTIEQADYGSYRDTRSDTWVAVDRQGRRVAVGGEPARPSEMPAGAPNGRVAGIFYLLSV